MSNLNNNTTQLETILAKVNALPEAGENDTITIVTEGTGEGSVQQVPRADKVTIADSETTLHFSFTGHDEANMAGRVEYGAVGNYSASFNGRSAALNKHAFAINNSTIAKGEESFAQGYETIAEGNSSVATGSRTWAKGLASHTEGEQTYTEGEGSHAEGALAKAMGRYSHAEGERTTTNGDNSHAEGALTQTGSFAAHAEGNATVADTNAAHAEGSETKVISYIIVNDSDSPDAGEDILPPGPDYNDYESMEDYRQRAAACAHAEGNHSVAMNYGAHAEGVSTKAYGHSSHTEGWGTQTGELMTMEENGQTYQIANPELGLGAHAEGYETQAIANYSHAEGNNTTADGTAAHAEGSNTQATEKYAHAEGCYTHADGQSSHAEGESTTAEGQYSHAEGYNTKAANGATHAEGYNVVAMGDRSHAEGDSEPNAPETYNHTFTFDGKTYNGKDGAYGAFSHREGRNTLTLGDGSHAEGIGNIAQGLASHAEGFLTEAIGAYSHASGLGTIADREAQTVVGRYNKINSDTAYFIVGAGSSEQERVNAFEAGTDSTSHYISIGETKLTESELKNIKAGGGGSAGPVDWASVQNKPNIHVIGQGGVKIGVAPAQSQAIATSGSSLVIGECGDYLGAPGSSSIAFGSLDDITATAGVSAGGNNSIAGGRAATADFNQSQAFGYAVQTGRTEQMVIGKYNAVDEDAYFVIGSGDTGKLDWWNTTRPGARNCFTVGNDGTQDYFTLGSTKITSNDLNKIEQHAAMINCITSATKNGSITLTQFGNTKYQGTFTHTVSGIVTGCVNNDSLGTITVKNTGTTATITVHIIKIASSNPLDDTTGSYNFTYYYIPIST